MHPDEAALLKAVCAAPDDDLPRLVFADWLDEQGRHHRADFIRSQIELARLNEWFHQLATREERVQNGPQFGRRLSFLRKRVRDLLAEHHDEAVGVPASWNKYFANLPRELTVSRGFIERVDVNPGQVHHLPELFAGFAGPTPEVGLHEVEYRLATWGWSDPFLSPKGWEWVTSLRPDPVYWDHHERPLTPGELARLSHLPLTRLAVLDLRYWELTDAHAQVLVERFDLPRLRVLNLRGNQLTPVGVRALSQARWWAGLCEIDLSCYPPLRGVIDILTTARIPGLRSLTIRDHHQLMGRFGERFRAELAAVYPAADIRIT